MAFRIVRRVLRGVRTGRRVGKRIKKSKNKLQPDNQMEVVQQQLEDQESSKLIVQKNVNKLAEEIMEFTFKLFKAITASQDDNTNVVFSPLSIAMALCIIWVGSKKKTADELKKALRLDVVDRDENVHLAFKEIFEIFGLARNTNDPINLIAANRIFVEESFNLKKSYLATLSEKYNSFAVPASFITNDQQAVKEINARMAQATGNRISNVVTSDSVNKLTRSILVNAVFFNGVWAKSFYSGDSSDGSFYRKNQDTISVHMMHQQSCLPFADAQRYKCKILILPYLGNRLSMILMLPDLDTELAAFERNLSPAIFKDLVEGTRMVEVKVTLAKFKINSGLTLKTILREFGVVDVFDENNADLSGIAGNKQLCITEMVHKVVLEVDEGEPVSAGGGAAAVGHLGEPSNLPNWPNVHEFKADHPFVFVIYDQRNRTVLFMGRVTNPTNG